MGRDINECQWRELLPSVFHWADRVKVTSMQSPSKNARVFIGVQAATDPQTKPKLLAAGLDAARVASLTQAWNESGWQGKSGFFPLVADGQQYVLVAVPNVCISSAQRSRQFGIDVARAAKELKTPHLAALSLEKSSSGDFFEGLALGFYDPCLFKGSRLSGGANQKSDDSELPEAIELCSWPQDGQSSAAGSGVERAQHVAKSAALMRFLQDAPPNWLTPERFGNIAKDVAQDFGFKCTLLGTKELESIGAGSFLSVSRGSLNEPRLIAIEIPGSNPQQKLALVGKGLTFDSGGISLKPSLGMGEMKYDMSGGAAVLATAFFLGKYKPAKTTVCIIGAVENMPGAKATRPGDIVLSMSGKSIDIQNTDAEGRLVLCDLLHYAIANHHPDLVVDVATLTGACLHALGHVGAAIMSNDQDTADRVLKIAQNAGEPLWQLPLWPDLQKEIKGEWSDLQNIAKPNVQAGTIIGGLFLAEFVGSTKWAHLDIAGTGWGCSATGYPKSGSSSYSLKTLVGIATGVQ